MFKSLRCTPAPHKRMRHTERPTTREHGPVATAILRLALAAGALGLVACAGTPPAADTGQERLQPAGTRAQSTASGPLLPGIDVWQRRGFEPLAGSKVALITNWTGRNQAGELTLNVLAESDALELVKIFTPEHGFAALLEGAVSDELHSESGLPLVSLYGDTRRPTGEMLVGIDGLVFDIQDIGTRFYTYVSTMAYAMEAAAEAGLPFVVLDRPNPITGGRVTGPVLDPELLSFVGYAPIPLRHGMTIGELASYYNVERGIGADLTVIAMQGWQRDQWFDATGLLWVNPSPNIRNLMQATLYPAVGPLETTNLSVGRGTDAPFEWFGAPWMNSNAVATALNAAQLPGVRFVPRRLTPTTSVHEGALCNGVNLVLTDREQFDAGLTAATLITTLTRLHGGGSAEDSSWDRSRLLRLWGDPAIESQLTAGTPAAEITASWGAALDAFEPVRARHLLYE